MHKMYRKKFRYHVFSVIALSTGVVYNIRQWVWFLQLDPQENTSQSNSMDWGADKLIKKFKGVFRKTRFKNRFSSILQCLETMPYFEGVCSKGKGYNLHLGALSCWMVNREILNQLKTEILFTKIIKEVKRLSLRNTPLKMLMINILKKYFLLMYNTPREATSKQPQHTVKLKIVVTQLWLLRDIKRQMQYVACGVQLN